MGPPMRIGLLPRRSISQPVGIAPSVPPMRKAVMTKLASPKVTSKDLARTGIAGSAMPTPNASNIAGRYVENSASQEKAAASLPADELRELRNSSFQARVELGDRLPLLHHVLEIIHIEVINTWFWHQIWAQPLRGVQVGSHGRRAINGAVNRRSFATGNPVGEHFRGIRMWRLIPQRDNAKSAGHNRFHVRKRHNRQRQSLVLRDKNLRGADRNRVTPVRHPVRYLLIIPRIGDFLSLIELLGQIRAARHVQHRAEDQSTPIHARVV